MSSRDVPCRACEGTGVVEEYTNPFDMGLLLRLPCAMCHDAAAQLHADLRARDAAIATDIDIYAFTVDVSGRRGVK